MRFALLTISTLFLLGCATSPARLAFQTPQEIYEKYFYAKDPIYLCSQRSNIGAKVDNPFKGTINKTLNSIDIALATYDLKPSDCDDIENTLINYSYDIKKYKVNNLNISHKAYRNKSSVCVSGTMHSLTVSGEIGPDSSFIMDRLLKETTSCKFSDGSVLPPLVLLESGGGYLKDGFKLGNLFRHFDVLTVVSKDSTCASSCAVAFLGGKTRYMSKGSRLLFHSPYYLVAHSDGSNSFTCDVSSKLKTSLNTYYTSMTINGDILMDRTMDYCDVQDGWKLTDQDTAKLFGVTNVAFTDIKPLLNIIDDAYKNEMRQKYNFQ